MLGELSLSRAEPDVDAAVDAAASWFFQKAEVRTMTRVLVCRFIWHTLEHQIYDEVIAIESLKMHL